MSTDSTIAIVVLAAGGSRRFGSLKQLQKLHGESLVQRAARTATALCVPVYVVIGAESERVQTELFGSRAMCLENPDWALGMGGSLSMGVREAVADHDPYALIVMLADQPLVTPEDLRALLAEYIQHPEDIVAADYGNGIIGPPCVFSSNFFPALAALDGDRGARALLRRNPERVWTVPMPHAAVDIDTPEDLAGCAALSRPTGSSDM